MDRAIRTRDRGRANAMNRLAALGLVERARALKPLIARDADEIERTRRLTPAVTLAPA